jgi:hypothetical protein
VLVVLTIAARICPPGIEGTLFAGLMGVLNGSHATSTSMSAALLPAFEPGVGCTSQTDLAGSVTEVCDFSNLWKFDLMCSLSSLLPLVFITLLPAQSQADRKKNDMYVSDSDLKGGQMDQFICSAGCLNCIPNACQVGMTHLLQTPLYDDDTADDAAVAGSGADYQPPVEQTMTS